MIEDIIIFDTTLRDGEQSPGCAMTTPEKIEMALQIERLGVDVMEVGFPIASQGDFNAVSHIAQTITTSKIAALARANENDIAVAAESIAHARQPRIHTFIATSDLHIEDKLKTNRDDVLDRIHRAVTLARHHTDDVEWSAEDATRTDRDYLCRCVETAIRAGATTINLPDTVGYDEPDDHGDMFLQIRSRVPGADTVIFSAHCHNDRGLAVANSLSAIKNGGVRQVECTVNGIGERAGNAALEQIVMAIASRPDKYPFSTRINTREIIKTSEQLVSTTGQFVQPNNPITGRNAFAHASGIHQHGMLANAGTYEIIDAESVGAKSVLVISKHSGTAAIEDKLRELGVQIATNAADNVYTAIMDHCDTHKTIDDSAIRQIVKPFQIV